VIETNSNFMQGLKPRKTYITRTNMQSNPNHSSFLLNYQVSNFEI